MPRALPFTMMVTVLLLTGCAGNDLRASTGALPSATAEGPPRPLWMASGTLRSPHKDQIGNGFADARYLDNGQLKVDIRANLVPLEEGHYMAWLLDGSSPAISAGKLTSPRGDGVYTLHIEQEISDLQPYKHYRRVAITWEPSRSSIPLAPHDIVIEGLLTMVNMVQ